jgi:hypothetical protein
MPIGGNMLTTQAQYLLTQDLGIKIHTYYEVAKKESVHLKTPPSFVLKSYPINTTESFKSFAKFVSPRSF